jgi:hypothetical protein
MDNNLKKTGSCEGAGLSVSVHPMAWSRICRIGTEGFALRNDNREATFLHARKLTDDERAEIRAWGRENDYLVNTQSWKVTYFDADLEERASFMFASEAEAVSEATELLRPRITGPIHETKSTAKLLRETHQKEGADLFQGAALDLLLTVYAQHNLDVDGVWWSDRLDPYTHSAPRGVILNSRLGEFEATEFDFRDMGETEKFDFEAEIGSPLKMGGLSTDDALLIAPFGIRT